MLVKLKRAVTALTLVAVVTIAAQGALKQAQATSTGIWISPTRLAALPTSGSAWIALLNVATAPAVPGNPTLVDQDSMHSRNTMATALVAARLDSDSLRAKVRDAIKLIKGSEDSADLTANRLLQLGRNMPGYVIAADLIGLRAFDPTFDAIFRTWIGAMRTRVFSGTYKTLANGDEHDPANWGAYDGAARAAIAAYLGDNVDLARSAAAFKSFVSVVGDGRWSFRPDVHDMSWQCSYPTVSGYTPIDAACSRDSHNLDGFMAQDMARAGGYQWPPIYTAYARENLNGRTIQAEILFRAGYTDVYQWGEQGLLRAAQASRRLDALDGRWFDPDQLVYRILATRYSITSWGLSAAPRGRGVSGVAWTDQPSSSSAMIDAGSTGAALTAAPTPTSTPTPTKVKSVATPTPRPAQTIGGSAPVVTAPSIGLAATTVPTSGVPALVRWSLASAASGIRRYELQVNVDNTAWTPVSLATATTASRWVVLRPGHRYAYRVRAVDMAGRLGVWKTGGQNRAAIVGDGSSVIAYRGSWGSAAYASYLGGRVHWTRTAGATATYRFSGASVSMIGPRGPGRGRSAVYLDGRYVGTIDQLASSFVPRRVLFVRNIVAGTHTIVLKALGTAGRPMVAIDAVETRGAG